jgi:transcription elongation factor Elf1
MRPGRPKTRKVVNNRLRCSKCRRLKLVRNFYRKRKNIRHSWCKKCEEAYNYRYRRSAQCKQVRRAWRTKNPDKMKAYGVRAKQWQKKMRINDPDRFRNYELKKRIGITLQEKREKFKQQHGRCGICKSKRPNTKQTWFADHDHTTKKFRGVLCGHCNSVLGYARDSVRILQRAIKYLKANS